MFDVMCHRVVVWMGLAAASLGVAAGDVRGEEIAAADVVARWSDEVWTSAHRGESDSALELLSRIPEGLEGAEAAGLVEALDRYERHIEQRETDRAARLEELEGELATALEEGDRLEALTAVLEMHMIEPGEGSILDDARVEGLILESAAAAQDAEREGDWLESYALFNRLRLLTEDDPTRSYRGDDERLRNRIEMLRLYVPEVLHDLQDARRIAEGEDPLPAYNGFGDDWRERLDGVDRDMVKQALQRAAQSHVERKPAWGMLLAGLDRVRTFVTTRDLSAAMPRIGDEAAVAAFEAELDELEARIRREPERIGTYDIRNTIDRLMLANRRTLGIDESAVVHEFGTGATSYLDEFTSFYWPDDLESFNRTASGNFTGVGIQISLNEDMELKVVTPVFGTPAFEAGIKADDLIREVDGHSTTGMGTFQAVQKIVGPEGTVVRLGIEREGEDGLLEFDLRRAVIPLYSVKGWRRNGPEEDEWDWMVDPESGIGYVRLSQFIKGSSEDLRRALHQMQMQGVGGVILDLRYNGGGLLDEAVRVANLFVGEGTIVTQEDAEGRVRGREQARRGGRVLSSEVPLVVLVNESSASASEIVSGALQDHDRAVIVGQRTFGKGSVQNVFDLARGRAAFKLTTQYYKLPGGRLIHRKDDSVEWGVEPDVEVEALPSQIREWLEVRLDADVVEYDENGELLAGQDRADPGEILERGLDPQLETALLLLEAKIMGERIARRASLD